MHHFLDVTGLGPWQRRLQLGRKSHRPSRTVVFLVELVMVRPAVTSSWSVVADDPLITKEEGLVVHFACCDLFDSFNQGNGNCGAFVIELGQARHPVPAIVPM